MPKKLIYKSGTKINKMIYLQDESSKNNNRYAKFRCYCNNEFIASINHIKAGRIKSCGCFKKESLKKRSRFNGLSKTHLYQIWSNMITRCYNKNRSSYNRYGGRGISVCTEWKEDASKFIFWAKENGYEDKLELDRINNDGNYEPSNCRFVSRSENVRNSTSSKLTWVQVNEIRKIINQDPKIKRKNLMELYNVSYSIISDIINNKTWQSSRKI